MVLFCCMGGRGGAYVLVMEERWCSGFCRRGSGGLRLGG